MPSARGQLDTAFRELGILSKEEFPSTVDCIRPARAGAEDEAPEGGLAKPL